MRKPCCEPYCSKRTVHETDRCSAHACLKRGCNERPLTGKRLCKAHAGHAFKRLGILADETAALLVATEPTVIQRGGLTIRLLRETDAPAILAALDKIDRASRRRAKVQL